MKKALLGVALAFGLSLTIPAQVQESRFDVKTPPTTDPVTLGVSPDGDKIFFVADRDGEVRVMGSLVIVGVREPLGGHGRFKPSCCLLVAGQPLHCLLWPSQLSAHRPGKRERSDVGFVPVADNWWWW